MRTLTLFGIVVVAVGAISAACSSGSQGETVIVSGWAPPPSSTGNPPGHPPSADGGGPAGSTDSGSPPHPGDSGSPQPTGEAGAAACGVPLDVLTMLANDCTGCHSDPPVAGSLAGLVTYADLMATAMEDPTKNEAQLSLARMQNAGMPMPPGALPSAADVTTLKNWINAGYPMAICTGGGGDGGSGGNDGGGPPPPPPPLGVFANAPPFTPMMGSSAHRPGEDCLSCHGFTIGGTVFDGSGNPVAGAEVRVVDATGAAFSVYSGSDGTFHDSHNSFTAPAHIGIRDANNVKNMMTALQSGPQPPAASGGACSACHCSGGAPCTVVPVHLP
jgi:hypothetical protein